MELAERLMMRSVGKNASKNAPWPRIDLKWVIIGACVLGVAYLVLMPLGFLIWESFHTPRIGSQPALLTLGNYSHVFGNAETLQLLTNSLVFAVGTSALAFGIGAVLAWINERTNTPFKSLFFALSVIPLIIPGILFTISWIFLASPKIGIINQLLQNWFDTDTVFFDIYSLGGMIWVEALQYSPMAFLFMTAALRSMEPTLEESALMSGASIVQIIWRITLRLTWPAIVATLLVIFVRAIESFEVPALLGLPVGIYVVTSAIFDAIQQYPSRIGLGATYSVMLLLITTAGIYFQSRLSYQAGRYSTVTGKGFRPRPMDLGRWRYLTAAIFIIYALVIVVLPLLVLLWASFQSYYTVPSLAALANVNLDAYRYVLSRPALLEAMWNSLVLALSCATIIMLLTSVICWIVVKTKIPGRWLLDNLASMPIVLPGLVLGLALMVCYLHFDIGVYGTMWILLIAYVTRFLPYGMRYNMTSMLQIHKELEESAQMSGASWAQMFWRVILPLLKPGLFAGWLYIVIVAIRELSSSILLYSPDSTVIAISIWEMWANGQSVELAALGVLFIVALFILVMIAQVIGRRYGVKDA